MSAPPSGSNLIGCSARELREIKDYLRSLERDLHNARIRLQRHRNARTLRLAREARNLRSNPVRALAECVRIVFGPAAKTPTAPFKRRSFAALDRRALPTVDAIAGALHRTVLADVVERCTAAPVVSLAACAPARPPGATGPWIVVEPHDFEVRLMGCERPTLLIDVASIARASPWYGVFGLEDMRLNLAMASLTELVRSRRGKVVFVNVAAAPPLLGDFLSEGVVAESFEAYLPAAPQ